MTPVCGADERREKVSATLQDAVAQVAQVLPNEISGSITELADEVLSALGSGFAGPHARRKRTV